MLGGRAFLPVGASTSDCHATCKRACTGTARGWLWAWRNMQGRPAGPHSGRLGGRASYPAHLQDRMRVWVMLHLLWSLTCVLTRRTAVRCFRTQSRHKKPHYTHTLYTRVRMHECSRTCVRAHTHVCIHMHIYAYIRTYTHSHTSMHTNTHTHTLIHTYTQEEATHLQHHLPRLQCEAALVARGVAIVRALQQRHRLGALLLGALPPALALALQRALHVHGQRAWAACACGRHVRGRHVRVGGMCVWAACAWAAWCAARARGKPCDKQGLRQGSSFQCTRAFARVSRHARGDAQRHAKGMVLAHGQASRNRQAYNKGCKTQRRLTGNHTSRWQAFPSTALVHAAHCTRKH